MANGQVRAERLELEKDRQRAAEGDKRKPDHPASASNEDHCAGEREDDGDNAQHDVLGLR